MGVEGDVADFVDDDQRDASESFEFVVEAAGAFSGGESVDPFGRGGECDSVAAAGGLDAERDREMGLAGAGRSQEDDVVRFSDEVELREVLRLRALDRSLEAEVEIIERLDLREPRALHAVLTAVCLTS